MCASPGILARIKERGEFIEPFLSHVERTFCRVNSARACSSEERKMGDAGPRRVAENAYLKRLAGRQKGELI